MKKSNARTVLIVIATVLLVVALVIGGIGVYRWVSTLWADPPPPPNVYCQSTIDQERAEIDIEQSQNASIIAGVAAQRGLIPRAVSIALATAFQESQIRNLDYGDRDSLGLFQQRPSQGWGTEEQIMDPFYSSAKFYEAMVKVPDWQTSDLGWVAQEVQRSGFPDAYDQHVARSRILASALTGETPAAWSCLVFNPEPADPDLLVSMLTRGYGSTANVQAFPAEGSERAYITITASTEEVAWSSAAFAQSWATATGVTSVQVGIYEWTASAKVLSGWIGVPESELASTSVIIRF
ncbi:MAG: hypothetical protein FWD55_02995 [Propionibacteriaceae bacterium]|nr:hypothetical protein [Propionibacteriaceae bacterium]